MFTTTPANPVRAALSAVLVIALALAMLATSASASQAVSEEQETQPNTEPVLATFDDEVIDISRDWGGAQACMIIEDEAPTCFATEKDMDDKLIELGRGDETRRFASITRKSAFASCSSSVRLYDGGWYTGQVLYLSTRNVWLNLGNYGFNQKTSSFKIGACDSYLADFNNGGGAWYSTSATRAWKTRGSMGGGWNNDVSSVYLK